jgi:hypothetical protein
MSFRSHKREREEEEEEEEKARVLQAKYERDEQRQREEEPQVNQARHERARRGNLDAMVRERQSETPAFKRDLIKYLQSQIDDDSNDSITKAECAKSLAELKKPPTRPPPGWPY